MPSLRPERSCVTRTWTPMRNIDLQHHMRSLRGYLLPAYSQWVCQLVMSTVIIDASTPLNLEFPKFRPAALAEYERIAQDRSEWGGEVRR